MVSRRPGGSWLGYPSPEGVRNVQLYWPGRGLSHLPRTLPGELQAVCLLPFAGHCCLSELIVRPLLYLRAECQVIAVSES